MHEYRTIFAGYSAPIDWSCCASVRIQWLLARSDDSCTLQLYAHKEGVDDGDTHTCVIEDQKASLSFYSSGSIFSIFWTHLRVYVKYLHVYIVGSLCATSIIIYRVFLFI